MPYHPKWHSQEGESTKWCKNQFFHVGLQNNGVATHHHALCCSATAATSCWHTALASPSSMHVLGL